MFDGYATLTLDPSKTTLSLTINGSLADQKFSVGNAKLFRRNCNNELKTVDIVQKASVKPQWVASSVVDLKYAHLSTCTSTVFEFVLKVYLFYSEPKISEVARSFVDFENARYSDMIVAVKEKEFKVHKAILMERSPVFETMVRLSKRQKKEVKF
jgi:hypothetical protein